MESNSDLPTLYARDSKGVARQWSVRTEGADIIVSHGQVGGKITDKVTTAKAKNIGKVNETTPESQAALEAQAKWTFQVQREDYHEDIEQAGTQLRPMLALDYLKVPHRVKWKDVGVQPKLDGLRLTVGNRYVPGGFKLDQFEMMTRKGEVYDLPHLTKPCQNLLQHINTLCDNRCLALDGEAYKHGMSLQQIVSRARRYQAGETERLQFHIFDLVIPGMPFSERYELLMSAINSEFDGPFVNPLIRTVPLKLVKTEAEMKVLHGQYCEVGFEGLMIRHLSGEYGIASRSPNLFKYKHFLDQECVITDVWEDKNGNAMLTCLWDLNNPESTFKCTPKRTHDERKAMLNDPDSLIGKWITVKYQALTDDGLPQFPIGLDLRECDEVGNPIL